MNVVAGQEYKIQISHASSPTDAEFTMFLTQFQRPSNDDFANAQEISNVLNDLGTTFSLLEGDLSGASVETDEPNHASNVAGYVNRKTVWYKFTPTKNGEMSFYVPSFTEIHGGFRYCVVAVYTGTALTNLVPVIKSSGANIQQTSAISFYASVGVTYYIAFASVSTTSSIVPGGPYKLHFTFGDRPSNNDFDNAIDLGDNTLIVRRGTTIAANYELGEPCEMYVIRSVWYKWRAPKNGTLTINIAANNHPSDGNIYMSVDLMAAVDSIIDSDQTALVTNTAGNNQAAIVFGANVYVGQLYYFTVNSSAFGATLPLNGTDFTMRLSVA